MNGVGPSEREIVSNMEAYAEAPWGERLEYGETAEYLQKLHEHPDGYVMRFAEPGENPYLYIHTVDYHDDVAGFVSDEFVDSDFYIASEPDKISAALADCSSLTYISNVHADRQAPVSDEHKPRLKIFPDVLNVLFDENGSDAIVYYTHRNSGVFRATMSFDPGYFDVQSIDYDVTNQLDGITELCEIDYLQLIIVKHK
jgi:hypothetical protein